MSSSDTKNASESVAVEVLWNASARAILDAIPGEAFLFDSAYRILAVNRALVALQPPGSPEPVGRSCHDVVHRSAGPPYACPLVSAAQSGTRQETKLFDHHTKRWYETSVSPTVLRTSSGDTVYLHVRRDVTDHWTVNAQQVQSREHERALNEVLRGLQTCNDSTTILAFLLDSLLALSWLGLTASGCAYLVEGGKLRMLAHRNLDARLVNLCRTMDVGTCLCGRAAQGEMVLSQHIEQEHVHRFPGMADHGHAIAPLMHEGQCIGVLNLYLKPGQALDAAQRTFLESVTAASAVALAGRMTQERERQAHDRLVAFERLQAVGRLAGGVAHDFNNLMTVILSLSDFVRGDLDPGHPMQTDIAGIRAAAMQAAALTRQLMVFSRKDSVQPLVLDLNRVLRDMEQLLRRSSNADVQLELDLAPDLRSIEIDPVQLDLLLTNLVSNARDAMPAGGKLRIVTANTLLDERDTSLRMPVVPGIYVRLSIQDDGHGITADVRDRLFEPFFTTKEFGQGTGMGLATVHGIVEQAAGNIAVESAPGQGTTFTIFLPVAKDEVADQPVPSSVPAVVEPRSEGETLLVADADEQLRHVSARILRKSGYFVLEAASAPEALLVVQETRNLSLLLTNVEVGGISGKTLAQQARTRFPGLRVLYMSDLAADGPEQLGALDDDSTVLIKPFGEAVLLAKLREALA